MAGILMLPEMSPWKRRALTIPPDSAGAWVRLGLWELWIGAVLGMLAGAGILLVVTAPHHIFKVPDFSRCYEHPVQVPCERILYRGGLLDAGFSALCGLLLLVAALWLLWELWTAVEPRPVTDDFLKLLNDSFARNGRDPRTWPWRRLAWAYGFTTVGAALTLTVALALWTLAARTILTPARPHVDVSQSYAIAP